MIRQYELVELVREYDPRADEDALNRAYVFAMKVHGTQTRASGDLYFSHPLEVAGILAGYKLDSASIVTALLHDTIEDTRATLTDIRKLFGTEIARLVDGVTKLNRLELHSEQAKQAENFRKLVVAMSEDIRVLLVKLADRLHNMRTLGHIPDPDKRRRIALETMEIYAPLAERIGMEQMKNELEDLAFAELHSDARESIRTRLRHLREEGSDMVQGICQELESTLAKDYLRAQVSGREKSPYSVWRKMQRKSVGFEQLADIMAIRVVVGTVEDCYRALGLLHGAYPVVPDRFKDYISTPKPNGYRSLHTCVIGPEKHRIEVQIRTREFHEVAEHGVAAHWLFKQGAEKTHGPEYRWLRELLDILEHASGPEEFLEHTKLEMYQDQVFCFSPRGDLIALPAGATPVDFAYAVHSEVGDTCVGSKVNGRLVPLRTRLNNGDQVEILNSKAQTPSPIWERFVVTGKARARIRRFVRAKQREQYVELGRSIMQRAFGDAGKKMTKKDHKGVLAVFKVELIDDLMARVGEGHVSGRHVVEAAYPDTKVSADDPKVVPIERARRAHASATTVPAVPIKGLIPGMAVHYASCCHPLPGDRIVGIVITGRGVTIHTIDCDQLEAFNDQPERWLDVAWEQGNGADQEGHTGRVAVTVVNEPGSLGNLSMVIAQNQGNISNLRIVGRDLEFFDMIIDIEVRDVKHLSDIIAALRATSVINTVDRARG